MAEHCHDWIEYVRTDGRTERIAVNTIERISTLSDGRGVIYIRTGKVIVVPNSAGVLRQWRSLSAG